MIFLGHFFFFLPEKESCTHLPLVALKSISEVCMRKLKADLVFHHFLQNKVNPVEQENKILQN
jgi:hypothetical protein